MDQDSPLKRARQGRLPERIPLALDFLGGRGGGGPRGAGVLTNESRRRRPSSRRTAPRRRVVNGPALASRARSAESAKPRRRPLIGERGAVCCSGPPIPRSAHPRTRAQCIPRRRIAENSAAIDAAPRSVARAAAARTAAAAVRVTGHDCSHEVTSRGVTAVGRVTGRHAAAAGLPASRSA